MARDPGTSEGSSPRLDKELVAQWHPKKNGDLDPSQVSYGSNKRVWWLCSEGHEWQSSPKGRSRGGGCPICSNKKLLVGYNDLQTVRPEIAREWHPQMNGSLTPQDVLPGADRKVWWLCSLGHEWEASLNNRFSGEGSGCPTCSGRKVLAGFNDLATRHPDVAAQWHPTRNGDLIPSQIVAGSSKRVWWLCPVGEDHEWEATVAMRTQPNSPTGCAVCAGRRVVNSTSLATKFPELAKEWHPHNNTKNPSEVTPFVTRKAWWLCSQGHEWEASIASRSVGENGCPYCSGMRAIKGVNDLSTTHPMIASEWHRELNSGQEPSEFKAGSNTKVWWRCALGHEFQAVIHNRTFQNSGCPFCAGQKPIQKVNDLQTTHPELASQWHPTKNLPLTADQVMAGTDKKVWWICDLGHEWQAAPYSRKDGRNCPVCANKRVLPGFNDLATTNPGLVSQLHPTRNTSNPATSVTQWSGKKVWWQCELGHEWRSTVANRTMGQGCPVCAVPGFNPGKPGWLYFLFHQEWGMFQIGISNVPQERLKRHQQKGWEVREVRGPMDGYLTAALERASLDSLRKRGANLGTRGGEGRFDGYTESWPAISLEVSGLRQILEWVHSDEGNSTT